MQRILYSAYSESRSVELFDKRLTIFDNAPLSEQEAQQELERLSEENAEMEERLIKLQNSKGLVTKAETDQIKKLHQVSCVITVFRLPVSPCCGSEYVCFCHGPPGSGYITTGDESGSFYHRAKIIRKTLIFAVL
jgi:hypothetical protein